MNKTFDLSRVEGFAFVSGKGCVENKTACVMTAAALCLGEPFTDNPLSSCISPVVRRFIISLNDGSLSSPERRREILERFGPRLSGSCGSPELEHRRAYLCADRPVRVFAPRAADAACATYAAAYVALYKESLALLDDLLSLQEAVAP